MRLTAVGKIVVLILAIGVAFGTWRWWQKQQAGGTEKCQQVVC